MPATVALFHRAHTLLIATIMPEGLILDDLPMKLTACLTDLRLVHRLRLQIRGSLLCMACLLTLGAGPVLAEVIDVDTEALAKLQEQGVPIIDIRRLGEWEETGVIEGSHLMTFFDKNGNYNAAQWFEEFRSKLEPGEPVVLLCRTGVRSGTVTNWLSEQMNITTVYNAKEGIVGWKSDGGATVQAP